MAVELTDHLDSADGIMSHLSPNDLKDGIIKLKKLKEFMSSEADEMRGEIHCPEYKLSREKKQEKRLKVHSKPW